VRKRGEEGKERRREREKDGWKEGGKEGRRGGGKKKVREGRKSCYIYSRCLIFIQVHVGLSQPHSRARLLSRTASDRKLGGAWERG